MDNRFPKYVRVIVDKLSFIALPNLGMLIAGLAILAFVGQNLLNVPMERFTFNPELVLQGDLVRLFAFPLTSGYEHPIWLFFFVLYVYFVIGALESAWGAGPLTVYVLFGYLSAIVAAFVTHSEVSIWYYILLNVSLAFGTIFPDMVFYILFVLPVKAKYLAMLAGGMLVFNFIFNPLGGKVFLILVLLPYLTWFLPMLIQNTRQMIKLRNHRKKYDKDIWR